MRRRHTPVFVQSFAALLLGVGCSTAVLAQRLAPVDSSQQCHGQRIAAMEFVRAQRPIFGRRFDPAASVANNVVMVLQPPTRARLIRHFLLLAVGDECVEQRRTESERILRAQPYLADVAIRALPSPTGDVLLRVETIDEYVLYAETWGWSGLPAGVELGTASVAGTGKGFRLLGEIGRGNELGWRVKYTDTQFLTRALSFDAWASARPYSDSWGLSLRRPFYTNFQSTAWDAGLGSYTAFYTFRDSALRDVTVDYERRSARVGGTRRLGAVNTPWYLGGSLEWERDRNRRFLQIRDHGPVEIVPPPAVASRYPTFDAARAGALLGYRHLRFHPVRGLGALSAAEDVAFGYDTWIGTRAGVGVLQRDPTDQLIEAGSTGAVGSDHALLRWGASGSWTSARAASLPAQSSVNARTTLSLKATEGHLTTVTVAAASDRHARLPTQLSFRDDETGLIGYRSANLGGAQRIMLGIEERHRLPLPTQHAEAAVALTAQSGRLWAGDAPFGVSTPWYHGVGFALLVALPAGSKQMLRVELGVPLNPPPGLQRREVRIFFSDRTGHF